MRAPNQAPAFKRLSDASGGAAGESERLSGLPRRLEKPRKAAEHLGFGGLLQQVELSKLSDAALEAKGERSLGRASKSIGS